MYISPKNNRDKLSARQAVCKVIKEGILERQPCETCKRYPSQAHHYLGYEKKNWLNVKWLCYHHHNLQHKKENI